MSDNFRKSILNRLPAMPPPMAPTRAPWAETDEDEMEELEEGDHMGDLCAS
jgi:protein phosphatase methylesterase 1